MHSPKSDDTTRIKLPRWFVLNNNVWETVKIIKIEKNRKTWHVSVIIEKIGNIPFYFKVDLPHGFKIMNSRSCEGFTLKKNTLFQGGIFCECRLRCILHMLSTILLAECIKDNHSISIAATIEIPTYTLAETHPNAIFKLHIKYYFSPIYWDLFIVPWVNNSDDDESFCFSGIRNIST